MRKIFSRGNRNRPSVLSEALELRRMLSIVNLGAGSFTPLAPSITFNEIAQGTVNPVYNFSGLPTLGDETVSFAGSFVGQQATTSFPVSLNPHQPSSPLTLNTSGPSTITDSDSSSNSNPVLSGNPRFNGPISVRFSTPVAAVGLKGGYFDTVSSTTIEAYDSNGTILGSITNSQPGFEFYGLADSTGQNVIAGLSFFITGDEPFGFAIDNLTFGGAQVVTPPAPANVHASDGTFADHVHVQWDAVPVAGATYDVWRNTADNTDTATQVAQERSDTSFDDTSVTAGTTYHYWVRAKVGTVRGLFSAPDTGFSRAFANGITVLVHGYTGGDAVSYWGNEKIGSLLRRVGGGLVYQYKPATGAFEAVPGFDSPDLHNPAGEIVLVDDWSTPSAFDQSGQAEAAADALFAALVKSGYIDPAAGRASKPFHFIGHSRGCSVVSEVVQRMGFYSIPVDYVTYLDDHDYGEPTVPFDEDFHDPASQVWSNVLYQDNFWEKNELPVVPSGRPLGQLEDEYTADYELTNLTGFGDSIDVRPGHNPHSKVVDWYFGTVAPGTAADRQDWYFDGEGGDTGFSWWLSQGGYGADNKELRVASIPPTNPRTLLDLYVDAKYDDPKDDNRADPSFFNGSFELADLSSASSADLGQSLAGWYYNNGVSPGSSLDGALVVKKDKITKRNNTFLQLDGYGPTRTHNRFYIVPGATGIDFRLMVNVAKPRSRLNVYVDDGLVGFFDTSKALDQTEHIATFEGFKNHVHTIRFEVSRGTAFLGFGGWPTVGIDDIRIATGATTTAYPALAVMPAPAMVRASRDAFGTLSATHLSDDLLATFEPSGSPS